MTPGLGDDHERHSEPVGAPNRSAGNLNDGVPYEAFGSSEITMDDLDADYDRLMSYSDSVDYYSLLGLPRNPPPTDAQLRSAYRSLSLSFYPDKHPGHLSEVATQQYDKIREAYETLIDDKKRVVYDLLGQDGIRQEWGVGGAMRPEGAASQSQEVGIRAMTTEEFRRWFLNTMRSRERKELEGMVQGRGSITVGVDASTMFDVEDDDVILSIPAVKASSFSLGYNFRIPLPPFKEFWAWRSGVDEEEDGEGTPKPNDQPEEPKPILALNARLGGKIQHPKQRVKVENEETGEMEVVEVDLPAMVLSRSLSLGASISHTFQEVGPAGGIFSRFPFSLLSHSSVSVSSALFPAPVFQTSIQKSVVPVRGTRPLQFSLQSTCQDSLLNLPPTFDLQIARQIGARGVAHCSWSTGTLDWPEIAKAIFAPLFALGPEEGAYLESPSKFSVGYVRTPQQGPELPEDDDEDAEGTWDSDDIQPASQPGAKFDPRETWSFEASTSPDGESITFNYGRNIFSGQPDKPQLSEWSAENHHSPHTAPVSRAVRLQVQTAITSDLSFAWTISGSRRVAEFTRMGIDVGVRGTRGLVFSVSWSRLGQSIRIPIAICPLRVLNYDIGALAVIFPWATYTAVEFGILRPRERRRRQRAIARRRKELKRLTLKRKEESSQATRLMSDQVKRRQSKEAESHGLVIRRAEYGHFPPPSSSKKGTEDPNSVDQFIDVTIPVAALVDKRQLILSKQVIKSQILGFYDPAPLLPKKLKIWYQFGDQDHFVEVRDNEGVTCPMKAHMVSP
ncbi:hypothetical protein FQN54_009719 [Arachnomyces sp. PD_36]|nr:hypothetical protein FQN54_009719 [Arachnomyces sp. PD_36]